MAALLVVAYRLVPVEFEACYTAPLPVAVERVRTGQLVWIDRPKRHI